MQLECRPTRRIIASLVLVLCLACSSDEGPTVVDPGATAAALSVSSGDGQTDQVGAELWNDVTVRATDTGGAPVAGVVVTVSAGSDGSADPASAVTDASGEATFRWTLGTAEGDQTLTLEGGGNASASVSAYAVRNLPSFDSRIETFRSRFGVPGLGVAVVRDGRLVYARGYGVADADSGEPVKAEHRFRIASVSKPITAAAVMQMVEDGVLALDDPAFAYLSDLEPPDGATPDPRLDDITIRHLLEHSAGWDRNAGFDPMFIPQQAADGVGAAAPASVETVIRYMLGQRLDFDPGSRYAYSNFGFAVLGRIIEAVSGLSYRDYMCCQFLASMGIQRMRIGRTRLADRSAEEVRYHDLRGVTAQSVFPGGGIVPTPYGAFHLEAMDAHGGWIASPVDLMRFVTSVDGRIDRADVMGPGTVTEMTARPSLGDWQGSAYWYAKGWLVRPSGGDANWWHDGLLAGTTSFMVRAHNGFSWVILANASAADFCCSMISAMDQLMWDAVGSVSEWPSEDLFGRFR